MLCHNIEHNLSWNVNGKVKPCNWLDTFPAHDTIEDMLSSEAYRQLKHDNCDNIKNYHCQKCWDKESLGQQSKRLSDNRLASAYKKINSSFVKIDAAIGSRCNAACVICGPSSSTLWQKELHGKVYSLRPNTILWSEIQKRQNDIVQIDLGGGEPWLNDVEQQLSVLSDLVQKGLAHKIKLRYNTNGSIYPKQFVELFDKFRAVEITLSIDDKEDRFAYNRWPLQWSEVLANLSKLVDLEKNCTKIRLTVNYTVSVFTFLYAQEFAQYSHILGIPRVSWSVLHTPLEYNIKSMPEHLKQRCSQSNIFYSLLAVNPIPDWKQKFLSLVKDNDARRGTNFENTFPELYSLIT